MKETRKRERRNGGKEGGWKKERRTRGNKERMKEGKGEGRKAGKEGRTNSKKY